MRRALALLAAGLLLAAGCAAPSAPAQTGNQGGSQGQAKSSGPVTIVWSSGPLSNLGLRQQLIDMFEQQHPEIRVQLNQLPNSTDTQRNTYVTQISSGSPTPDVYSGDVIWPAQFAAHGLAMPLDRYFPRSVTARLIPGAVQADTFQGKLYAVPWFTDAGFLYYRKDLLQRYDLPVPATWDQLFQEAQTLQQRGAVRYGFVFQGAQYEGLVCDFTEMLAGAGGQVLAPDGKVLLDSPQAVKAAQFLRKLVQSGVAPEAVSTYQEPDSLNVFATGDAAFLRNWPYAWAVLNDPQQSKVVGKVGMAVLPDWPGGTQGPAALGGWNLFINPHSKHVDAAVTFIKFLISPQAQKFIALKGGHLPVLLSAYDDQEVRSANPFFALKPTVVPRPSWTPNYPELSSKLQVALHDILTGQVTPAAGIRQASQEIRQVVGQQ
ncbi:MAG: ABC transporter substrate-binding protein [Bacillota bacterium]|nr:ABC transporter substrate-binding protein [Bacillota bacterium]